MDGDVIDGKAVFTLGCFSLDDKALFDGISAVDEVLKAGVDIGQRDVGQCASQPASDLTPAFADHTGRQIRSRFPCECKDLPL